MTIASAKRLRSSSTARTVSPLAALMMLSAAQAGVAQDHAGLPTAEAPRPIVIGQSYRLSSAILGDTRVINVQLPEHYADTSRKFPILFLLDGGEREDFEHIAGLARINAAYGQGEEIIVVGIEGVDRRHDLTSPSSVDADRKLAPTSGGSDAYRLFLERELGPWVNARFRTNGRTAIMGESLAGLFVLETFLQHPGAFTDYISVSPSLWWNGRRLTTRASSLLSARSFAGKRIWIAFDRPAPPAEAAAKDRATQRRLEQAFRTARPRGLSFTIVRSVEGHGSIYHPAAVQAFRGLYGPPAP